jgi:putative Holliday junction resolvase
MAAEPLRRIDDLYRDGLPAGRLLGLDLGTKTIGLAISDVRAQIATALTTLKRTKFSKDVETLLTHATRHDVCALVIGLPLNMDGSSGPRAQATRAFVRSLAPLTPLPIVAWDERLSTVAANNALLAADLSRAKRADLIDAHAAAFILQGALDRLAVLRRAEIATKPTDQAD